MTKGIAGEVRVSTISRGVIPLLLLKLVLTVMVIFIPQTVLWLPGLVP